MTTSAAWLQQRVDDLCAAAIRAQTGDRSVHFRGRRLHQGSQAVAAHAPHLRPSLPADDFGSFRGAADGMALRLRHSDPGLHRRLRPDEPVPRLVFDMLEQFRVESLAEATQPGLIANLRHRHERWSLEFHRAGHTETAQGILLYTLAQICRSRVTGEPVVEATEDLLEATRFSLAPLLGSNLRGLRLHREDQLTYARHALAIASVVGELIREAAEGDDDAEVADPDRAIRGLGLLDIEDLDEGDIPAASSVRGGVLGEAVGGYRAFVTDYDRERRVTAVARPALLAEYRERLDARIVDARLNVARVARQLRPLLSDPAPDGTDGGQEEGRLDGRRLAQLVSSPTERRLFRVERSEPAAHALVTFLVDCSGSMKQHAESIATLIDVFARALELVGASCEVLGFTTGAWNGGRAMRDWRRSGRPANPGRLNEVCHLVFKDADTSYRRSRPALAGILKADLFREGVDGEALSWACRRMRERGEPRKLLVVFSDGSPMDSATALVNDAHYLDNHLAEVVEQEERDGALAIFGVGLGLDLSRYYRRTHALEPAQGVSNAIIGELIAMLAARR
ncbi:MAG: cobalt chelatase [Actinophytocola sp.]|nr:cobalt chelatase [Actinophytocola sp.]